MIDFTKTDYIAALWFVGGPAGDRSLGFDWMAAVYRDRADNGWRGMYRFRYYSGTLDPFDDTDRKSWYSMTCDGTEPEEKVVGVIDLVAQQIARDWGVAVDRVDVRGDQQAFIEKVAGKHWLHLQADPR